MRKKAPRKIDSKVFRNTANRTKSININYHIMKGGIRL